MSDLADIGEDQLVYAFPVSRVRRNSGVARRGKRPEASEEVSDGAVRGVGHDDDATAAVKVDRDGSQALLVLPREDPFVVSKEAVVCVSSRVGRVEIDEITRNGRGNGRFEVV